MEISQRVGTYAFIRNADNRVLIVQRAAHDTHPNMWELPGGGIDDAEHPTDAVIREAQEEAGITVTPIFPFSVIMHESTKAKQVFRIVYLCHLADVTQNVVLSNEHTAYRWVHTDEILSEKPSEFLVQITKDFQRMHKYGV